MGTTGRAVAIGGELIAQRSEFMVPRDWIDVPVPWSQASEHWLDIVHALEQLPTNVEAIEKTGVAKNMAQVQGSPNSASHSSDDRQPAPAASLSPVDNVDKRDKGDSGLTDEAAFIADVAAARQDASRHDTTVAQPIP